MRTRGDLFDYQKQGIAEMVIARQLACFLEPGWGKTIMTLTALDDLLCSRVLVLAPAMVVETNVWGKEAARWEHLRGVSVRPIVGGGNQRDAILRRGLAQIPMTLDVISYENFVWLTKSIDLSKYDAIVIDELSKLKHPGTVRFRQFRHKAMKIPIRFGLTGSPVGNRLEDLWGEMFAVCGEAPLGPSKTAFLAKHFYPVKVAQNVFSWKPLPTTARDIHARIKPYAFTLDARDAPAMPELRVNAIDTPMPESAQKLAAELASEFQVKLDDGVDLRALSETALATKMRQLTGGSVYTTGKNWSVVHDGKLDAVQNIIDELQGQPALLFYWYAHEHDRLVERFGAVDIHERSAVERWNDGGIPLLLAHPQSAGHGLNLQHGGHNAIWFSLPWSLEMWQQSNGRLVRHGQKSPVVVAHVPLAGPADRVVLGALTKKGKVQDALLAAVRR
jgi:hypothetical protein